MSRDQVEEYLSELSGDELADIILKAIDKEIEAIGYTEVEHLRGRDLNYMALYIACKNLKW